MSLPIPNCPVRARGIRLRAWLLGVCLVVTQGADANDTALVFDSTETPPIWSAALPSGGMGGELLRLLSDAAGVSYSINYLPASRFSKSTAPYIVGNPNLLKIERNRAIFPIGVLHLAYFYYPAKHKPIPINRLADISGHTLGVLRGTIEDRTQFDHLKIKVQEADSIESLLRMLQKGRVDVAFMVEPAGEYAMRRDFPGEERDFVVSRLPNSAMPIALMVDMDAPNGADIAKRYRLALDKTLHDPQYEAILRKHHDRHLAHIKEDRKVLDRLLELYEATWHE